MTVTQNPTPPVTNPAPPPTTQPPPETTPPPISWRPPKPLSQAFGITIDYSVKSPQEWDLIAGSGVGVIRFDLQWATVEKQAGVYDFVHGGQNYDALVDALIARHIRPLFILDYGNPLYDQGKAPTSDAGRSAFAAFAAAAARRYAGKDVIWEIWNEPDDGVFWNQSPESPNAPSTNYALLCQKVIPAIRVADPSAYIAVGAVSRLTPSTIDFISELGRSGVLQIADAVSVHPYRDLPPESAASDYASLRTALNQVGAINLPIIDTECGKSTGAPPSGTQISDREQASILVRTRLADLISGVQLSIWYTWTNSSNDPGSYGGNFGMTQMGGSVPRPAYFAAGTLQRNLAGTVLTEQPNFSLGEGARAAKFSGAARTVIVLWSTDGQSYPGIIPLDSGNWSQCGMLGDTVALPPSTGYASVTAGPEPTYLILTKN